MKRELGRKLGIGLAIALAVWVFAPTNEVAAGLIFNEVMGPSLELDTQEIGPGVVGPNPTEIWKFILNASGIAWLDYHIDLEVKKGGIFEKSGELDGISFDQPTDFNVWRGGVKVDIDGVDQGPAGGWWDVQRMNVPFDQIWFEFHHFVVDPGETLSLHFDMRDFQNNTWRLHQEASPVPEPSTLLLLAVGILGTIGLGYRQRKKAA